VQLFLETFSHKIYPLIILPRTRIRIAFRMRLHLKLAAFSYNLLSINGFQEPFKKQALPKMGELMQPPKIKAPLEFTQPVNSTLSTSRYADYPTFLYRKQGGHEDKSGFSTRSRDKDAWKHETFSFHDDALDHKSKNAFTQIFEAIGDNTFNLFDSNNPNKKSRILENRAYSKNSINSDANAMNAPTLQDLAPPKSKLQDTFWASLPAGFLSFFGPFLAFPYLVQILGTFVRPMMLDDVTESFGPGVSILYGTFVSLTLSILYKRKEDIQNQGASESSLLAITARNMITLFKKDRILAIGAGQSAADQIRVLTDGSRGDELMLVMYNDPYARMLELLENKEDQMMDLKQRPQELIGNCRDNIRELYQVRATRLSDEALSLPRNHFFILTFLTVLILFGYTVQIAIESSIQGLPSNDSSVVFGLLCAIYILFYNFANDLNDPFGGIYQVRRSATASHLMQLKWFLINHPTLKGEIDFNAFQETTENEVVMRSPGLEEIWFTKNGSDM